MHSLQGLYPIYAQQHSKQSNVRPENGPDTPYKILWKAIFNVIAPQPSAVTQVAIANAKNNLNMSKKSKGKSW